MTSTTIRPTDTLTVNGTSAGTGTTPTVSEPSPRLTGRTTAGILLGIVAVAAVSGAVAYAVHAGTTTEVATTGSVASSSTDATELPHGSQALLAARPDLVGTTPVGARPVIDGTPGASSRAIAMHWGVVDATSAHMPSATKLALLMHLSGG
jgi:hypothetical protein